MDVRGIRIAIALPMIVLLAACAPGNQDAQEVTRLWIGPSTVPCQGVGPMDCLQVATSADGEPQLFYDPIEGFEFIEGTSYVIDVRVTDVEDPPADASSKRYALVKIVEQQQ